jgi:hypothetical protein
MIVFLYKAKKPYKYKVLVYKKVIKFGAADYEDYTIHKDAQRKKRYIERHKKNENWKDYNTRGFWSKHLLWNKTTLKNSAADIYKRFNIRIKTELF